MTSQLAMAMISPPSRAVDGSASPHIALAALAALLAVFCSATTGFSADLSPLAQRSLALSAAGFPMLVVLAGFVLARRWSSEATDARGRLGQLSWLLFLPYVCALFVTLALFVALPAATSPELMADTLLADAARAFSPGSLLSHILLLQNFFPRWQGRVNPLLSPFAAAAQGALILALVYWPLARRLGTIRALAAPVLVALLPLVSARGVAASSWMFALPALGACVALQQTGAARKRELPFPSLALGLSVAYAGARLGGLPAAVCDLLAGAATVCLLAGGAHAPLFSSRFTALRRFATYAYPLYLLHVPLLGILYVVLSRLGLHGALRIAALTALGLPASALLAAGFHRIVQRRFQARVPSLRSTLRFVGRAAAIVLGLLLLALGTELLRQRADVEELNAGQTFADVSGRKVRYKLEGKGTSGPLVVFNSSVHSLEEWDRVAGYVSRFTRTLRFDRCGMGLSSSFPEPCTPEASAEELNTLLDVLGEKQPVIVVGYSISGVGTRAFLARHPQRVAAALLVDPFMPETDKPELPGSEETRHFFRVMLPLDVLKSSLGLSRLRAAMSPTTSDGYGKGSAWQRVQLGTKHAYSVWRQADRFSRATEQDLANEKSLNGPLVMLSGAPADSSYAQVQQRYVAGLKHGEWRPVIGVRHELLVRYAEPDGPILQTLQQLIEKVAQRKLVDSGSAP